MATTLHRTPFYDRHLQHGGKMVDFAGWEMPVQYTSIKEEHLAVRSAVGVFDISHMGQIFVWGAEAEGFVDFLITNDVKKAHVGKGIYAHLLNTRGGVIDDIFVYRLEAEKFLLIVNASRKEVDFQWISKQARSFEVELLEAPMAAALAIQGPKALPLLQKLSENVSNMPRFGIAEVGFGNITALAARTGYTGEDGMELFAPAGHLLHLWDTLFEIGKEMGLTPCGLGARDTLRTEMGYPLYGHELDEDHTSFEAGLSWVVKMDKEDFIGKEALLEQKEKGLSIKLVGFQVTEGGVARPGGKVKIGGEEVGTVTSGTFSPSLGIPIGMAFLPFSRAHEGVDLDIVQGTRQFKAQTCALPFLKLPKAS